MKRKWPLAAFIFLLTATLATTALAGGVIRLLVNGREIKPEVAPRIIQGRTMVPLRWVAEALGSRVVWDETSRTVVVTTGDEVWDEPFDYRDQGAYGAITAVTRYLSLLQRGVNGSTDAKEWEPVLSRRAFDMGWGMERVWRPMGGVGSSVRTIPRFDIFDGRVLGKDAQERPIFQIAVRFTYIDLTNPQEPYQRLVKAYSVIPEEKVLENGGKVLLQVIDEEQTLTKEVLSGPPDPW